MCTSETLLYRCGHTPRKIQLVECQAHQQGLDCGPPAKVDRYINDDEDTCPLCLAETTRLRDRQTNKRASSGWGRAAKRIAEGGGVAAPRTDAAGHGFQYRDVDVYEADQVEEGCRCVVC